MMGEFGKDFCMGALANIEATLAQAADALEAAPFDRPQCRWLSPANEPYDVTDTLAECFRKNNLRQVLRWIEFQVPEGVARRKRLVTVLIDLRDRVSAIENGDPSDPFLWMRESIDLASAGTVSKLRDVAEHVKLLAGLVGATQQTIPAEHRTIVMSKSKAAGYLRRGNRKSAVRWLSRCIGDGTISCDSTTPQSHVFDARQFPESVQAAIRPK